MSCDAFDEFSYAAPGDAPFKRFIIRLVERMTGQPRLKRLYRQYQRDKGRENFWEEALRRLRPVFDEAALARWPATGPLVIVCNRRPEQPAVSNCQPPAPDLASVASLQGSP